MTKVLCVGSSCKDIFFPTEEGEIMETPQDITRQKKISFELGAKYKIDELHESSGGCAANVAIGLVRLMVEVRLFSAVGDDENGKWILSELEKNDIKTETVKIQKLQRSGLSAIIVDKKSAERVIFSNKSSANEININAEDIADVDWIFLGDIHGRWEQQMEKIIQLAQREKKKIIFNPRELHIKEDAAEVIEAIGLSDAVFLNKDEAIEIISKMHGDFSLEMLNDEKFLLGKILELEPKIAVLTDGRKGAWAGKEGKIFFARGLEVAAVDSTGAGDAFLSGFLAAYIQGKNVDECLKWGIANSSKAVQFFGGVEGLLSKEKIEEESKKVEVEEIKK